MSTPTVGFVQISSAAILNKARALFLDTHFSMSGAKWSAWNKKTSVTYSRIIAEIARIVVHPEYRNLGLGKKLLRHAFSYAKHYWQVGKMKPLFVEITADMLKFVPLPEKVGMAYIGDTEGNMHRLGTDLRYAFNMMGKTKTNDNCMERLQQKYLRKAVEILKVNGLDKERLLFEISTLSKDSMYQKYELLHDLLRMPKPVYMKGLTRSSQLFLTRRQRDLGLENRVSENSRRVEPLEDPILFEDVTVSYSTSVPRTIRTSLVQESFGINPNSVEAFVFHRLDLRISPKELVLVVGASGSGKTTLLRLIKGEIQPTEGRVSVPRNARFDCVSTLSSHQPMIEEIGRDFESSLCILNKVGLSDFRTYLLTYDQLSAGQRYRGLLAKLIDSEANLWILDDFLCNLDRTTQAIIANNIQRVARDTGVTMIAACCDCENFVDVLKPDKVLAKDYGPSYQIFERRDYESLQASKRSHPVNLSAPRNPSYVAVF
jgi:ABC-type ATPase with predicted acetyltransferase domain